MTVSTESLCSDCFGACCMGPQTMQLTLLEKAKLEQAGTNFETVAEPVGYDRNDVIYPIGADIYEDGEIEWVLNETDPYEPLPAGCGRYMRFCKELSGTAHVVGMDLDSTFETDNKQQPFGIRGVASEQ